MANDGGETAARIYEAGRTQRDDDQATAMLKRLLADARAEVASLLSQLREARAERDAFYEDGPLADSLHVQRSRSGLVFLDIPYEEWVALAQEHTEPQEQT